MPIYAIGRLGTLLIRRDSSWAVGSAAGVADGPLAVATIAHADGKRIVWLATTAAERDTARAHGFEAVDKHSLRGYLATARAEVTVVSHGLGDVNRYGVAGSFVAQLWHGIPLKRIGLDSEETTRVSVLPDIAPVRALLSFMYRRAQSQIRVLPAASHLVRGRLESAFGLGDERIVVTGEPRVDVLSRGLLAERREHARARLAAIVGELPERVVLYAPTWRDGAEDPAVPDAEAWHDIIGALDSLDAVLLIRSHPLGSGAYVPPVETDRVRALPSTVLPDVTVTLAGFDALVTDYSSLLYDVGLLRMPVVYLAPDVASYGARRGFYGAFSDVAGDDYATTWQGVTAQLQRLWADSAWRTERENASRALSQRVHAFHDGNNAERVYREIERRRRGRSRKDA